MMMRPRRPWHEVATRLVDVAAGRAAAELVIRNGRWVNVLTREVVAGIDIAVCCGRIACIVEDGTPGTASAPTPACWRPRDASWCPV